MNFDENLSDFVCGLEEDSSMSKNATAFLKSYARTCTVMNVAELEGVAKKSELISNYLDFCYSVDDDGRIQGKNPVEIHLDKGGFENVTTNCLPNVNTNSGNHLHLVEFFTHCCINCIHSIEDVREVHEEIEDTFQGLLQTCSNGFKGMKVLSIHSPKFPREKDMESIKAFCKRMKMDHSEVVNDPQCILWNEFGVTCWPTLLIMGPNPNGGGANLLFTLMGEGHKDDLLLITKIAMEYFCKSSMQMLCQKGNNNSNENASKITDCVQKSETVAKTFLRFPGKVAVFGDQIVVADSGNNRLIVLRPTGRVERIIGGPDKGSKDGNLNDAKFYNPQGIACVNESIFYVADTGNHSVRKVDLQLNQVSTLINTGYKIEINGESIEMKSPWDLAFYDSDVLIIAAAGNHRLFGYFFEKANVFGAERTANTLSVIAGSGREENRNNSYILKASFAQPSGIAITTGSHAEKIIYIADSESSSIRSVTPKAQVVGLIGGSRDPTDLFAFGDADGKGINAKLQHPMGVCTGRNSAEIFITDTYNHKIKRINVESKECVTFISTGLDEPSGICKDPARNLLYVADTNNHSVKCVDLENANVQEIDILPPDNMNSVKAPRTEKFDKEFCISISSNSVQLKFSLSPLPEHYEAGRWKIIAAPYIITSPVNGEIENRIDTNEGIFEFTVTDNHIEDSFVFNVVADVFFCTANGCLKRTRKIKVACKNDSAESITEKSVIWNDMSWE